jgi:dynamin 1-like protein
MEACYINTAHPDFLNGHQAIAMVNERIQPKQPQANEHSTKTNAKNNQVSALQTNNSSSNLSETDSNGSLFGSFFSGNKKTPNKSVSSIMDMVSSCLYKKKKKKSPLCNPLSLYLASYNFKGYWCTFGSRTYGNRSY